MQQERSALNSFPEPIDLNQRSLPEETPMDHSASWNDIPNQVENRMPNFMLGGTDGNISSINAANVTARTFDGWDRGQSSSRANNMQDGAFGGDSIMRVGRSSSFNACPGLDARSEDWFFEPSNTTSTSYVGNLMNDRPLSMQSHSSNRGSLNLNLNHGHSWDHDFHRGLGVSLPHNMYKHGHSEMEQVPVPYASSSHVGTFSASSSTSFGNRDAPVPSFGTWGSSCKRKALEGSSGHFYPGGSSDSHQPMEKNVMHHPVPGCHGASGTLSISSGPLNLPPAEQLSLSGVGMSRRVAPGLLSSSNVPGVAESSARTLPIRSSHGRHESVPLGTPRSTSVRISDVYSGQQSRLITYTDSSELRSPVTFPINQHGTPNQPHLMHSNEVRGTHSYHWDESTGSRGATSSGSFMVSGERGSGAHEEVNVRSSPRINLEFPTTVSAPETRNVLQDQIDWSFVPGISATSRIHPSGSRIGPSSGGRPYSSAWLPHQFQTMQNHQRSSESSPWDPFSRADSESVTWRNIFPLSPPPEETASTSQARHHQLDQRSATFWMDAPGGDDINSWRALSSVESRHRLIRQVFNAMRRGVHLQEEDYMLIDPFINGFAELQDRHRDLRLDVDNMSYEELLALEEWMGDVNTGLSEEKICSSMKQHKYKFNIGALPNLEPCCICQEDYVAGEDIGTLDCGHEFHTGCIKQWLMLKNLCPICKMTALET